MTANSEITFIETSLQAGREPELAKAFTLLQQAVDIDQQAKSRLSEHLWIYLSENIATSHVVAALYCLYIFDDMGSFKEAVLRLGKSKRQRVRCAVASCLSDFGVWDECREDFFVDEEVIALALSLTRDISPSVRDWAVFQFNNGIANNSSAIRKALLDRVNDKNLAVEQEAIVALTARGETRYYSLIQEKLKRIDVAPIWIEAACVSRHKPFVTDLEELLEKRRKSSFYQRAALIDPIDEAIAELDSLEYNYNEK